MWYSAFVTWKNHVKATISACIKLTLIEVGRVDVFFFKSSYTISIISKFQDFAISLFTNQYAASGKYENIGRKSLSECKYIPGMYLKTYDT